MASLNRVLLIGNLTRDPEVRHTPKGTAVGDLGLAINMRSRTADGQVREEVCYVDVVVWGRLAENCKEFLTKGAPIFVEGRLQLDQWESQQGEKRSRLRVRAENVQFLGRATKGTGNYSENSQGRASDMDQPTSHGADDHFAEGDDEIPF
jgi:single-strand DNA-binding protein